MRTQLLLQLETPQASPLASATDRLFSPNDYSSFQHFSAESIFFHSDDEHHTWSSCGPDVRVEMDMHKRLCQWLRALSDDELDDAMSLVPIGMTADPERGFSVRFTPWQRVCVYVMVCRPFDVTCTLDISRDVLVRLGNYKPIDSKPTTGMHIHNSVLRGSMLDFSMMDLPTAGGKTSLSCCAAFLVVGPMFHDIKQAFRSALHGRVCKLPLRVPIARVVLIATGASTHDHFVTTIERLMPEFKRISGKPIKIWKQVGASTRLSLAFEEDVIVFWVVPIAQLNAVLRLEPEVSIAVGIVDEFVKVPSDRLRKPMSPIVKRIVLQATPQKLTCSGRNWITEVFEGPLNAPCHIGSCLESRQLGQAVTIAHQAVELQLRGLGVFRSLVRNDLKMLMPAGLDVYTVVCTRASLVSLFLQQDSDLVPASLARVVSDALPTQYFTADSMQRLQTLLRTNEVNPSSLAAALEALVVVRTEYVDHRCQRVELQAKRMAEHTRELVMEHCPVCFEQVDTVQLMGCCGGCVCAHCHSRMSRCCFCRTAIPSMLPRSDAERQEVSSPIQALPIVDPSTPVDLGSLLTEYTRATFPQLRNVAGALIALFAVGARRALVTVQANAACAMFLGHVVTELATMSHWNVTHVDPLLNGKGTEFAKWKRCFFDTLDSTPRVLLTVGMNEKVLIGTNLDFVDGLVVVGDVRHSLLVQMIGRVLRPRASRNNQRPIPVVRIRMRPSTRRSSNVVT